MRARALRAPVFLGSLPRQTGRCAPPTHHSFAAFSSYSKNKNNLPSCPREEPFSFNSTTEAREYSECKAFYPVVRIGSPHPLNCKRVWLPPLDPRGKTHLHPDEGVGENQFRRWGIHTYILPPLTSQLRWSFRWTINRKKPQKNHSVGVILRYQWYVEKTPRNVPVWQKIRQSILQLI